MADHTGGQEDARKKIGDYYASVFESAGNAVEEADHYGSGDKTKIEIVLKEAPNQNVVNLMSRVAEAAFIPEKAREVKDPGKIDTPEMQKLNDVLKTYADKKSKEEPQPAVQTYGNKVSLTIPNNETLENTLVVLKDEMSFRQYEVNEKSKAGKIAEMSDYFTTKTLKFLGGQDDRYFDKVTSADIPPKHDVNLADEKNKHKYDKVIRIALEPKGEDVGEKLAAALYKELKRTESLDVEIASGFNNGRTKSNFTVDVFFNSSQAEEILNKMQGRIK